MAPENTTQYLMANVYADMAQQLCGSFSPRDAYETTCRAHSRTQQPQLPTDDHLKPASLLVTSCVIKVPVPRTLGSAVNCTGAESGEVFLKDMDTRSAQEDKFSALI
ncbi:unnamed protein product [Lota lota]